MVNAVSRWSLLCIAWLAVAPTLAAQTATNTLLLIADDVGIDGIGVYGAGASPPPTPNLDQLGRGGVLFRNALANPLCSPTRATIYTGRYSFRTGVGTALAPGAQGLALSEHTLPEILDANGTRHALLGKWHLGDALGPSAPNQHGWSHYVGSLGGQVADYFAWQRTRNGITSTSTTYATTDAVNEALAWISAQNQSWVCVVGFQAAHTPLHAPPASLHTQNLANLNPGTTPRPFYKAMVEAMDSEIGRLLGSLPSGVRARTNVIFVGDNGTPRNVIQAPLDPLHGKGTLYEGGTRVPLLVAGPAVATPGREVSALVNTADLFATICELQGLDARARVPATVPLDSISMAPYLASATQTPLRPVAHVELFGFSSTTTGHAVRDARWKLIRFTATGARDELYDLAADPQEQVNLFSASMTPEQRAAYETLRVAAAALRGEPLALEFGSGCAGSAGVPVLSAPGGGPRIGASFTLRVASLSATASGALLLLGASRTLIGTVPLPIELSAFGMPTCQLHTSSEVVLPMPAPVQRATQTALAVPNDTALISVTFFAQAFVVELLANPASLIVAPALAVVVGSP